MVSPSRIKVGALVSGALAVVLIVVLIGMQSWAEHQSRQAYCGQCPVDNFCQCSPQRRELMVHLCASPSSAAKSCLTGSTAVEDKSEATDVKLRSCLENEAKRDPAVEQMIGRVDQLMDEKFRKECLRTTQVSPASSQLEQLVIEIRDLREGDYALARGGDAGAKSRVLKAAPGLGKAVLAVDESVLEPAWRIERLRYAGIAFLCAAVLESDSAFRGKYGRDASDYLKKAMAAIDTLDPESALWARNQSVLDNLRYLLATALAVRCAVGEPLETEVKRLWSETNIQYRRENPPRLAELRAIVGER